MRHRRLQSCSGGGARRGLRVRHPTAAGSTKAESDGSTHRLLMGLGSSGWRPSPPAPGTVVKRNEESMDWLLVSVTSRTDLAEGVTGFTLSSSGKRELPSWQSGAHIDVRLPSGLVRQYSLCGSHEDRSSYSIAVQMEAAGRGGSREILERITVGQTLEISAPRNRFRLRDAESYLFIAGGIGITPILPMVEECIKRGKPWQLVYGGRSRSTMAFVERVEAWGTGVTLWPQDEVGLIDFESIEHHPGASGVYVCGPPALIGATQTYFAGEHPADEVHYERFQAMGEAPPVEDESQGFEVQVGVDGPIVNVDEDDSILHALVRAGYNVAFSCEEGICGTCESRVIDGDPLHCDRILSASEHADGAILICVSRSKSRRLVLELDSF